MSYRVEYSDAAQRDLTRLVVFLAAKDAGAASEAMRSIRRSIALLEHFPFSCRKAGNGDDPTLREIIITFGNAGYVAIFKIRQSDLVTILGIRHQFEADYD